MLSLPTLPRPGDKISAKLISDIILAIKARTPINGKGVMLSQGPNGTVISTGEKKTREHNLPGCFDIKHTTDGFKLVNRYFSVGSKVYELEDDDNYSYENTFVCLNIDLSGGTCSASISSFDSITLMRNEATDNDLVFIVPLYHVGDNGSVICDMRNMPMATQWEFDS